MKSLRERARAASTRLHTEAEGEAGLALTALQLAQVGAIPLQHLPSTLKMAAGRLMRASAKSAAAGVLRVVGGREPEPTAAQHRAAAAAAVREQYLSAAGRCPRCYFGKCDVFAVEADGAVSFKLRCNECGFDQRTGDA